MSGESPVDFPKAIPLDWTACFHDHDPNAAALGDGGKPHVGVRLLKYGIPHCSGTWGCGTGEKSIKNCPPWPAGLEQCDTKKVEPQYCAKMCLSWMPDLVFSGSGGSGNECWCSNELNTDGPPANKEADKPSECNTNCKGNAAEKCGGYFYISVHHVHEISGATHAHAFY